MLTVLGSACPRHSLGKAASCPGMPLPEGSSEEGTGSAFRVGGLSHLHIPEPGYSTVRSC